MARSVLQGAMRSTCLRCVLIASACFLLLCFTHPTYSAKPAKRPRPHDLWDEVEPGVWRTLDLPHTYALLADNRCLLIGAAPDTAPGPGREYFPPGIETCELLLITHHHRDSCAELMHFAQAKIPILRTDGLGGVSLTGGRQEILGCLIAASNAWQVPSAVSSLLERLVVPCSSNGCRGHYF